MIAFCFLLQQYFLGRILQRFFGRSLQQFPGQNSSQNCTQLILLWEFRAGKIDRNCVRADFCNIFPAELFSAEFCNKFFRPNFENIFTVELCINLPVNFTHLRSVISIPLYSAYCAISKKYRTIFVAQKLAELQAFMSVLVFGEFVTLWFCRRRN